MARKGPIGITDSINTTSDVIAASATAVKTAYDKTNARFNVIAVSDITDLSSKENGWYSIKSETLDGVTGNWIVVKFGSSVGNLYTATNLADPRIVLNSTDLTNWYSPYAYWHA